ncbi:MAG: patatin-like phospholipase family protein [Cyanobacteriota bacterium]|nr:patatin-like phospholipase family protein [Cyanobacteriota bacterium]
MAAQDKQPFRVLTLDGGGMRGMYQAAYLHTFAHRIIGARQGEAPDHGSTRIDIGKCFDLIAGTSTGSIVAAALALHVPMDKVMQLYRDYGKKIFPHQWMRANSLLQYIPRAFGLGLSSGDQSLREALTEAFGKITLGENYHHRKIAMVVPSVDLNRNKPVVFKTPHLSRLNDRDGQRTFVDICRASTAAPILRSIAKLSEAKYGLGNELEKSEIFAYYTDGGLWANNPALLALCEAREILAERKQQERPIHLFMLGALSIQGGEELGSKSNLNRSAIGWQVGIKALGASLDAQSYGYDYMASKLAKLLSKDNFAHRLESQCPPKGLIQYLLNMDDAREKVLAALCRQAIADVDLGWSKSETPENPMHHFRQALDADHSSLPSPGCTWDPPP